MDRPVTYVYGNNVVRNISETMQVMYPVITGITWKLGMFQEQPSLHGRRIEPQTT